MIFAESLAQIGLNIIHGSLSFLHLPQLLETINQSSSIHFDDTDAEPLVRALVTVFSKAKHNEDRVLIMLLIKAVANWWRLKETIWEKLCRIVDPLAKDDDEAVRVLSIPMTVAPLQVLGKH